jgi:hypothetical protein
MHMPQSMPARLSGADQPVYAIAMGYGLEPQLFGGIGDWIQRAKCLACCKGKAGFLACVARCVATGEACDGGLDNCTPC